MTDTLEYLSQLYARCTPLVIEGTTTGSSITAAFIVLLREKDGKRLFPALLSEADYHMVHVAMKHGAFPATSLTARTCSALGALLYGVRLQCPDAGRYEAFVDYVLADRHIMMRASLAEAVCLATEMERPIVTRPINLGQNVLAEGGMQKVMFPLTAMSRELLDQALQQCVENDNFEQASAIRDELKRRG